MKIWHDDDDNDDGDQCNLLLSTNQRKINKQKRQNEKVYLGNLRDYRRRPVGLSRDRAQLTTV